VPVRPSASIVIPVWNGADLTDACLKLVTATIRGTDEVVIVDNGSCDHTAAVLARHAERIRVVSHSTNLGFAAGCNSGAEVATKDVVVFLNNDTLPVGSWLDDLLAPFADPVVGATGPLSNFVSGIQLHRDPAYAPTDLGDVLRQAQGVKALYGSSQVRTHRLVGFCLAVLRGLFTDLGGFDTRFEIGGYEDDDLCRRITAAGHDLVVARGAFVHHIGHQTFNVNGVDWAAVELANRDVMAEKLQQARELSVLVLCDGPAEDVLLTIAEVVDHCADPAWRTELLLLARDPAVVLPIFEQLSGDVSLMVAEDDDAAAWRRGLLEAEGNRRALLRSGEVVDPARLAQLMGADRAALRPSFVGRRVGAAQGLPHLAG
jgi:GT2 family glycosyltransferase